MIRTIADKMNRERQRGATAIEFAILFPWGVFLFVLIFELSILLYDLAVLTNASREGARAGIVFSYPDRVPDAEIQEVVEYYCKDHLISLGATSEVTTVIERTGDEAGDPLTVIVSYPYTFFVLPNFIPALVGGIPPLAATTVMRME